VFAYVAVLGMASCSGGKTSFNPVHGTILYKDSPAGGVMITLHPVGNEDPKAQVSAGSSNDDGTFEIMTGESEGAPVGEYYATFVWMQETSSKKKQPVTMSTSSEVPTVDKLKGKYTDRKKPTFSGIIVKKGQNQLDPFKLQ
jgi:5-hydroxyisourate hydrolase-like protein (transthyretin family)